MHHGQAGIRQVVHRGLEVHARKSGHAASEFPVERPRCVLQLPQNGSAPVQRRLDFGRPVPEPALVVPSVEMNFNPDFSSQHP